MNFLLVQVRALLRADRATDRIVPPTGFTAHLTIFVAAAMAFLAVFALALSFAASRLADRWEAELAGTATVRISATVDQMADRTAAVLRVLGQTPGIADARALTDEEQRALLAPWFGPDLPLEALPVPRLVEFREVAPGYDAAGLGLRLEAEAPGAVLDDHGRWRRPLVDAAAVLRTLGYVAIGLIGLVVAALIALAAGSALAANAQVIRVLRLVGARDAYIARAFVRRFTARTVAGALAGTLAGMAAVAVLPDAGAADSFLTGLSFSGAEWLVPLGLPAAAGMVAYAATRLAAFRALRELR